MEFYNVTILQDVVSFCHYTIMLARSPDTGKFQISGEILVDFGGGVRQCAARGEYDWIVHVGFLSGCLGVYTDNLQELENSEF